MQKLRIPLQVSHAYEPRWWSRRWRVRYFVTHPDGSEMEISRKDASALLQMQTVDLLARGAEESSSSHDEWCGYRAELERQRADAINAAPLPVTGVAPSR